MHNLHNLHNSFIFSAQRTVEVFVAVGQTYTTVSYGDVVEKSPGMRHAKIAEPFRQIAPWNCSSIAIENSLHKEPLVPGRTSC